MFVCTMFVLSVLEAPNTRQIPCVCKHTCNKALSDSDSDSETQTKELAVAEYEAC